MSLLKDSQHLFYDLLKFQKDWYIELFFNFLSVRIVD